MVEVNHQLSFINTRILRYCILSPFVMFSTYNEKVCFNLKAFAS